MRSNDSLRRLGANFVKMLVLVMCFVTVFAIVMTADLSGIGTDSAGNVAEARGLESHQRSGYVSDTAVVALKRCADYNYDGDASYRFNIAGLCRYVV